ncbi:MAG: serine hydrolase [Longimicrobiales bacterium]|nr:serine hydrolase [Longimicrobiales bacterium]
MPRRALCPAPRRPRLATHPLPLPLLLLLVLAAPALVLPAPRPAVAQQVDLAALDAYFARAQREWPVPGLSVAIVKDGEIVLEKGYGVRDVRGREPVDAHTLYAIASNSKAFTAAALAQQVDAGRLSWDDRVLDHLPWFRLYDDYVTQEMRIRDLLSHRSGLGTYSGDLLWYGTPYTAEEVVRRARHLPPAFSFRDGYGYSNLMFIAAGEVLRAVTGEDWHAYVESAFFGPLGMTRSVTSTTDLDGVENVATPHKYVAGETIPVAWYNWDAMGAAGGIISSVHDMAQWLTAQLAGGAVEARAADGGEAVRLFSEARQREMWTVLNPRAVTPGYKRQYPSTHFRGYGMGWSLNDYLGRMVASHGGGYDGMYSQVALVPEEGLGVVVLTNGMTGVAPALVYRVLDAYLGGEPRDWSGEALPGWRESRERFESRARAPEEARVAGTTPSLPLEGYAGRYGGPMYGDATVTVEGGGLVLRLLPNPDLVADLEHLHYDTFVIRWRRELAWFGQGTARFVLDEFGRAREVRLDVPNDDLWFHELEFRRRE